MIGKFLKRKIMGEAPEAEPTQQFYSPLRIALHSTINIQLVDLVLMNGLVHHHLTECVPPFSVDAIGKFSVDSGEVFRVYLTDSLTNKYTLQLMVGTDDVAKKGGGYESVDVVEEAILFRQVLSEHPASEAAWDRHMALIGFENQIMDGNTYTRLWGDKFTEKMELLTFNESIVEKVNKSAYTNHYLLYSRDVKHPITELNCPEYLLVGVEENDDDAEFIMQVGIQLALSDIEVT